MGAGGVVQPVPLLWFGQRVSLVQIHRGEVVLVVECLIEQATDGEGLTALAPVRLHFGFGALS